MDEQKNKNSWNIGTRAETVFLIPNLPCDVSAVLVDRSDEYQSKCQVKYMQMSWLSWHGF